MTYRHLRFLLCSLAIMLTASASVYADDAAPLFLSSSAAAPKTTAPRPFIASTAQPFAALMDEAMARMHTDMMQAPRTGEADADFVSMMIPHHQGAVDMAKALLLYTKDPELRNLALQIVTEQQNEIKLMEAWRQSRQRRQPQTPAPK